MSKYKCVFIFIILLYLFWECSGKYRWQRQPPRMFKKNETKIDVLKNTSSDIIKDTTFSINKLAYLRYDLRNSSGFEVGYVIYTIVEKYRRMVDIYNTTRYKKRNFYLAEQVMFLDEIEHLFWDIEHLTGMLHEIERKFGLFGKNIHKKFDPIEWEKELQAEEHAEMMEALALKKKKKRGPYYTKKHLSNADQMKFFEKRMTSTKRKPTRWWWPIEYGWEIDYDWP